MKKISQLKIIKQLLLLEIHYLKSLFTNSSFANEYPKIKGIVSKLNITDGFVVDMAASDGVSQSCTLEFFKDSTWSGLALEMDPDKFAKLSFLYANFPNAKLARGRITPHNVVSTLLGFEVPNDFSLLNLDIDSYDLYVIYEMLKGGFRPKIISMEINEKIPSSVYFTVDYDEGHYWKGDHFYGCSLRAASETVKPFGYFLESLQYNNAIFVRSDLASHLFNDTSVEAAYEIGYKNKPDRKKLFPWNADVECLLEFSKDDSIKFINNFFSKYDGKYSIK
jgi:hypothetical protein